MITIMIIITIAMINITEINFGSVSRFGGVAPPPTHTKKLATQTGKLPPQ